MKKLLKEKYTALVKDQKEEALKDLGNKAIKANVYKNYNIKNLAVRAATNVESFGFLDYNNEGQLALTNPLIGLYKAADYIKYGDDFNDGCWIGCRALKATLGINIDIIGSHWCVCIDGYNYSLTTDSGGADGKIIIEQTKDKDDYTWYRFGKVIKTIDQVDQFVRYINNAQIQYTLLNDNCQKFSYIVASFACDDQPEGFFFKIIKTQQNDSYMENKDAWRFVKDQLNFKDWKYYEDNKEKIKYQKQLEKDFKNQGFTTGDPNIKLKEMLRRYDLQTIAQMNTNRPKQTIGSMQNFYSNQNRQRISYLPSSYNYEDAFDKKNRFNYGQYKQASGQYNLQPSFNLKNNIFQNSLGYSSKNKIPIKQQSLTQKYNRNNLNRNIFQERTIPDMFQNARKRIQKAPFQEQIQQQQISQYNEDDDQMNDIDYINNENNDEEQQYLEE